MDEMHWSGFMEVEAGRGDVLLIPTRCTSASTPLDAAPSREGIIPSSSVRGVLAVVARDLPTRGDVAPRLALLAERWPSRVGATLELSSPRVSLDELMPAAVDIRVGTGRGDDGEVPVEDSGLLMACTPHSSSLNSSNPSLPSDIEFDDALLSDSLPLEPSADGSGDSRGESSPPLLGGAGDADASPNAAVRVAAAPC